MTGNKYPAGNLRLAGAPRVSRGARAMQPLQVLSEPSLCSEEASWCRARMLSTAGYARRSGPLMLLGFKSPPVRKVRCMPRIPGAAGEPKAGRRDQGMRLGAQQQQDGVLAAGRPPLLQNEILEGMLGR